MKVLDVGSMDINGSFALLFKSFDYKGLDIAPGPNVDIVVSNIHHWPLEDNSFEVVISGSCLEHVEHPWSTMREIARVLKPGGLCCIIAPSNGPEHRYPVDCYRYFPDGLKALAAWADLEVIKAYRNDPKVSYWNVVKTLLHGRRPKLFMWRDSVLIAKKGGDEHGEQSLS